MYPLASIPGMEVSIFIEFVSALGKKNHQELQLINKWYRPCYRSHPLLGFLKDLSEFMAGAEYLGGPNARNVTDRHWLFT